MKSSFQLLKRVGLPCVAVLAWCVASAPVRGQGTFTFDTPAPITILDGMLASPYPSSVAVSGANGVISRVAVTLLGLTHTFPDDLDVLLVGPTGQKVVLMSDAGGGADVAGINLRLEDGATLALPDNSQLLGGTNRPADFEPGETFPAPAPAGPYASTLGTFAGRLPNGTWSLYVLDDRGNDSGVILNGWRLELVTVNPATVTDLGLGISDAPDPVTAGTILTWTIGVTNYGPLAATTIRLTNPLPASVTFQSATSPSGTCSNNNGVVVCSLSSLGVNATAQVTISVIPLLAGSLTNTATVRSAQADVVPANNAATAITTVGPALVADLRISMTDAPDPVIAGSNILYSISVTNLGPLTAVGTIVTNLLDPSLTFVSAYSTAGFCGLVGRTVTCNLGDLASGGRVSISLLARPRADALITNTVRVFSSTPDLTPATATVVTDVNESADLAVRVIEPFDPVAIGNPVTYTLLITNLGVNEARQVSLVETLPVGVAFRSAIPSQGTCQNFSGVLFCDLGSISNGGGASVFVEIQPLSLQPMVTGVSVSSPVPDPNPTNNLWTETTTPFPIGSGIFIVPTNDATVLGNAVTSAGFNGLRVTDTRLQSWATTNLSTAGFYFIGATPSTYGLTRGGIAFSTGNVKDYQTGPNRFLARTTAFNQPATPAEELLLDPITSSLDHFDTTQFDLHFDMLPGYDFIQFQVVFGSEEWPDLLFPFVDGFGIYLNGTNIAFAAGQPINVFHPDMAGIAGTELNGVLAPDGNPVLTFTAPVVPGSSNNVLSFILSDTSDGSLDTTVYVSSFEGAQSPNADLAVTITSAPSPVVVGSNLTYTITVQNLGPYIATNVIVATLIPPQVQFVSVTASQGCIIQGDLINCFLGTLDRLASDIVTLVVRPQIAGPITNATLTVSDLADFSFVNNYAEIISTAVDFGTFASLDPLPIFDAAPALPYPSVLQVSGLTGVVTKVTVQLLELSHTYPADLDVLLVDPTGRKVMLMSDAGWDFPVAGVTLQFDEDGFDGLPQFQPIVSGTYSPTDHEPGDPFLGFPPGFTYGTSLSELTGRSPNGPWSLYIMDDRGVDTGVIGGGWRLSFMTGATPAAPTLAVRRVGGFLEISWDDTGGSFLLESKPVLSPAVSWTPVAATPVAGGGRWTVVLPLPADGNAFYRLRL